MKISAVSQLGTIYSKQIKEQNKNKTTTNINNYKIANNTISEAIGRSQVVSFSGINKTSGNTFEHDCSEVFGDKEHISYNKDDGSFTHQIFRRNGSLKRQEEFYPQDNTEIITTVNEYGDKTVISRFRDKTIIEKINSLGQETLYQEKRPNGYEKKIITDNDRQRKIFQEIRNGQVSTKVLDLKTNKYVRHGELVIDTRYDKYTNTYYTENIVTGQVLKEAKYLPNGKIESLTEYSEETGLPIKEIMQDTTNGGYLEYNYTKDGVRTSFIITSKDGLRKEVIEYGSDGKTITKDIEYKYFKNGNLDYEISYIPNTRIIDEEIVYEDNDNDNDKYTIYQYNKSPNVPKYAEFYSAGKLLEQIVYFKDGETIRCSRRYKDDGSYIENYYTSNGYRETTKYYTKDGFLYIENEYNRRTGLLKKKIEHNRQTGQSTETHYYEETRLTKRLIIKNKNGEVEEQVDYYEDGKTPKKRITFNYDRSYAETLYDEFGRRTSRIEYNADGSRKVSPNSNNNTNERKSKNVTVDEYLKHINDVLAHDNIQEITKRDWEILAKILEVDNADLIEKMDSKTYKKLAMKFHPDTNIGNLKLETCEQIIKIINSIYAKRKKL